MGCEGKSIGLPRTDIVIDVLMGYADGATQQILEQYRPSCYGHITHAFGKQVIRNGGLDNIVGGAVGKVGI